MDAALVAKMKAANVEKEARLGAVITDAVENQGEDEVREGHLALAMHLVLTADKERALEAIAKTMEKTVGLGQKLDLVFAEIRLGLFFQEPGKTFQEFIFFFFSFYQRNKIL